MIGTFATIVKWVVLLPVLVAVLLIAVANDQAVTVHLNPFDADDPVLRTDLALYQVGFILFILGALTGGLIVWMNQRRYRRLARTSRYETARRPAGDDWPARADETRPAAGPLLPRPERL